MSPRPFGEETGAAVEADGYGGGFVRKTGPDPEKRSDRVDNAVKLPRITCLFFFAHPSASPSSEHSFTKRRIVVSGRNRPCYLNKNARGALGTTKQKKNTKTVKLHFEQTNRFYNKI